MIVAWVMTRELDVGKAFAVSAARIPSIMESNDQIVLISVAYLVASSRYTLDLATLSSKAYN